MKGCLPGQSLQAEIRASGPMDQSKAVRIKGGVWERSRRSHSSCGPLSSSPHLWSRSWSQSLLRNQASNQDIRAMDGPTVNTPNCIPLLREVGEEDGESGRVQTGAEIRRD